MTDEAVEPIAIVGLSLRVPGAPDAETFWRNLVDGVESRTVFDDTTHDDPAFVPASFVLDGLADFDHELFGMTAQEADLADPQQRLFLEHAHAALLDAGCDPARYPGEVGVYAGTNTDLYHWLNVRRNPAAMAAAGELRVGLGNKPDYLASTVSYRLNLRGPSLAVHTACSSSLVAVHLAAEALRSGECDAALAGGVCVELPHHVGYVADEGYTAADGHCRPFDAAADGTVYGSGVGVVLLKRLADAQDDGDTIRAVILGDAVNNDGATKVGFTAPSVGGQAEVVAQALGAAGIDPRSVSYVEAHGTGTVLGDSIEMAALTAAYTGGTADRGWCGIGSVKANIGHLSQASGVVGLIKVVLALQHRMIPPSINFEEPHPELDLAASPYYVVSTLTAWEPDGGGPRRAGVSSLGLGGTNAHVVLQEAPPVQPANSDGETRLWQVSASTPTALASACTRLAAHLSARPELDPRDIAHTLRSGRPGHRHRAAVVAADARAAVAALTDRKRRIDGDAANPPRVAFLFPGQGAQFDGMAAGLYKAEPVFAAAVDECGVGEPTAETELFAVEYALATLWQHWGVRPAAMIGHSVGELVAATIAGVFDLPDALRVVAARERLAGQSPPGRALAVRHAADQVAGWLPNGAWLSVVNGPGTCVVAGRPEAVESFEETLRSRRVGCTMLRTSHAFHTPLVEPTAIVDLVAGMTLHPPRLPIRSSVTAEWLTDEQATDPAFWAGQLCQPVLFGAAVANLAAGDPAGWQLLECGPGRQLAGLARTNLPDGAPTPSRSLPAASEKLTDQQTMAEAAGRLWVAGVPVEPPSQGRRIPLPGYPYERTRHWIDPAPEVARPAVRPVTVGTVIEVPVWRQLPATPPARCLVVAADDLGHALAERLRAAGSEVTVVAPGQDHDPADHVVYAAALAGGDVYPELRALAEKLPDGARLDVVTANTQDVLGGDQLRPEHATVAGVVRVLPLERAISVRWTDIDTREESTVDSLVAELGRTDRPALVALRRGRRWTAEFDAVDPPAADPIRPHGRFLITGGTGRFGLALAEELAVGHHARLVLLSRTPPPDDVLDRLRGLGAEVRHVVADVTDTARLREVRAEIDAAYDGLDGIVHAARLPETGVVTEPAAELRPKVAGSLALREVFGDLPLDFVVLCSSVAGGLGRMDEHAANAVLAAHALGEHGWRTPPLTVDWGVWRGDGPDQDGLTPAEGVDALRRVLAAGLGPRVAIGAYPVAEVVEHERDVAAQLTTVPSVESVVDGDLAATVASVWGEVLGVEEVGHHDDFFRAGGTSLVAAQLVLRIRQAVGVRLSMRVLFDAPTVATMVARIEQLRATSAPEADAPIPRLRRPGRRP